MIKKYLITLMVLCRAIFSQDPQFSQYYAAPLLLNPAMAGAGDCYRTGFIARSQWTGLPGGAFNTVSAFIDLNVPDLHSGFGIQLLHDDIGTPRMSANDISGFYSYEASFGKRLNLRLGAQASLVSRSLNYSRLVFEDQFTGTTVTQQRTGDPMYDRTRTNYADFSSGLMLYGDDTYWIGGAFKHLFTPDQAFYTHSKLPFAWSIHGGYNFKIGSLQHRKTRLIPTFLYKSQMKYDQLDLGAYLIKEKLLLGLWYRGIAIKKDEGYFNRDAISMQVGYYIKDFSLIYSYDVTVSKLGWANTLGSHELSLIYQFCSRWPKRKKPPLHVRRLPCPDFDRSLKYNGTF